MSYLMTAGMIAGWLLTLAVGLLGWQLLRQNGRLLLRMEALEKRFDELEFGKAGESDGLPVGAPAPGFDLPDLTGKRHTLEEYGRRPVLLIFFSPGCGFCRDMTPRLAALTRPADTPSQPLAEGNGEVSPLPLIISTGEAEANRQLFNEHKVTCPVLLQKEMDVAATYKANGTPSGYLISAAGKVASELALGADSLLALLASPSNIENQKPAIQQDNDRANRFKNHSLARSKLKRDGLKAGTPAPDFRLPRLDGRGDLTLSESHGQRVLLLFSSPHCKPCDTLAPKLEEFHRAHSDIQFVMLSRGEPGENRVKVKEHGLTFPIALQQQWEISQQYAMFATPVGYLIDEAGMIAHDVAVGVDAILELMQGIEDKPARETVESLPTEVPI